MAIEVLYNNNIFTTRASGISLQNTDKPVINVNLGNGNSSNINKQVTIDNLSENITNELNKQYQFTKPLTPKKKD